MVYLVGNWKSNKHKLAVERWFADLPTLPKMQEAATLVLCPAIPYLYLADELNTNCGRPMHLGVQHISAYPQGAYSGEVAADMVADVVSYALVGHSERRIYMHQTSMEVANAVELCIAASITPIVCVDEPYLETQLAAIRAEYFEKLIVAYEPLEAIGSGKPDSPEHANEVAQKIRSLTSDKTPVIYGGSIKPDNLLSFLNQKHISGGLAGGSSLDPESWFEMAQIIAMNVE